MCNIGKEKSKRGQGEYDKENHLRYGIEVNVVYNSGTNPEECLTDR